MATWPGHEASAELVVDGVVVPPATPLDRCGLWRGSTVGVEASSSTAGAELEVVAGPLSPTSARLDRVLLLGRGAGCTLRLDHPSVDRAHALLEPAPGGWRITPLSVTHPTTLDGEALGAACLLSSDAVIGIGAVDVQVVTSNEPGPAPGPTTPDEPGPAPGPTTPVHRAARSPTAHGPGPGDAPEVPATPPAPPPPGTVSLVAPVAIGVVLAMFVHPTAGLITAATPLLAISTHLDARRRWRRRRRRDEAAYTEALDAHERAGRAHHRVVASDRRREHPSPVEALGRARAGTGLWSARAGDPDADDLAVGWGTGPDRAPVTVAPAPTRHLGIAGPRPWAEAVARAVTITALTRCGPHERAISDQDHGDRGFLRWLPHGEGTGPPFALVGSDDPSEGIGIELAATTAGLTDRCDAILSWAPDGGLLTEPRGDGPPLPLRPFVASERLAERWARAMARWTDGGPVGGDLPDAVSVRSLMSAVVPATTGRGTGGLAVPLGIDRDGTVPVDLVADGPHALVAGTTGAGKSELLRTWVTALAWAYPPTAVAFVLVDYKGGSAFDACGELPHVAGVVTDLDAGLGERLLVGLRAEVRDRERVLRAAQVGDLRHLEEGPPRLVVVVDEFATLAAELPDFLGALVDVARRGRSLGIHLVLATQRPAGAVNDEIRANTALRLCLRTLDPADSQDVIGGPEAATLSPRHPGRAWLRAGGDLRLVQVATGSQPDPDRDTPPLLLRRLDEAWPDHNRTGRTELEGLVPTITRRWRDRPAAEPVWRPPLPEHLVVSAPGAGAPVMLGREDRPAERRQPDLTWDPAEGHLVVLGGRGRGRTTTLRTALLALAASRPPQALHLHVVAPPGPLDDLAALPHLAALVDPRDRVTLRRLVRRLEARSAIGHDGTDGPLTVVAVDAYESLAAGLDDVEALQVLESLDRLAREGTRRGVVLAVTGSRPSAMPPSAITTTARLLALGFDDPADHALLGLRPPRSPLPPGRGQTLAGHEVQVGRLDLSPAQVAARHPAAAPRPGPSAIAPLPTRVTPADLTPAPGRARIGLRDRDLRAATVALRADAPFVVVGPPRSGRTAVLDLLAGELRGQPCTRHRAGDDPAALLGAVREWLAEPTPHLFVVDDAEAVDDPAGQLRELVGGRHPAALLVVALRADTWRSGYGRWVDDLRPAGHGVALGPDPVRDAECWTVALPTLDPAPPPGRGVLVDGSTAEVVQVAHVGA